MPFHHFPAHFVYWTQIPEHKEIRKTYLPKILDLKETIDGNTPFKACKLGTSLGINVNDFLYDSTLVENLVLKPLNEMLDQVKMDIEEIKIVSAWFNTYEEGDFQELHEHNAYPYENVFHPCFSLVYILNNPGETNDTVYRLKNQPFLPLHTVCEFDTSQEKSITEGTLIITSSSLPHLVKPCSKSGRVTIAYNVFAKFRDLKK